ncbi:MAG: MATE family efflux transporter, partial [Rhodospirillaceae bacterium]
MYSMPNPAVTPNLGDDGPDWFRRRLRRDVAEMLRLAPPIVLARSGIVAMILVDTLVVGRYSAIELGYLAIAMSLTMPLIVTGLGLILGTMVLTANHLGAGRLHECGAVWQRAVVHAFGLGLIGAAICTSGETLLAWTGQTPELAREGGRVYFVLGLGIPAHLVFLATSFFLEGLRRPVPGMVWMLVANVVNLGLTLALVFGVGDVAPAGAVGAAWGTTAARWVLGVGMVGYVLTMRDHADYAVRHRPRLQWALWRHQRRLGYAMGLSLAVESIAFSTMQQFAGWLGPVPLAAFSIAFQLMVASFMVAIGIGAATAVRVGIAHGREDHRDVALAGWTGLAMTLVATGLVGVAIAVLRHFLPTLFTTETAVAAAAAPLIVWVAAALMADGGQAVMANALRGVQDVWAACAIQA